jgi:Ca2+-binding EF-hand superfamily protein
MNETFDLLDMSLYDNVRSYEKQIESFVYLHDKNFDERLNRAEFIEAVNQTMFALVLEDALKSINPNTYYEKTSGNSIEKDMRELFPKNDSLLGQKDLLRIVKYFDSDSDGRISREEIRKVFVTNKAKLVEPYKNELTQAFD